MRKLHKKPLVLAVAAIALTGSLTVGSAMAYFTTYATAGGGVKMNMGFTTTVPDEKIDEKANMSLSSIKAIMIVSSESKHLRRWH